MSRKATLLVFAIFAVFLAGCASFGAGVMPSQIEITKSQWADYETFMNFYNSIKPYKTTLDDLKKMGFDPEKTKNVTFLKYIAISNLFFKSPAIRMEDLPLGIQDCFRNSEICSGYKIKGEDISTKGKGNIFYRWFKCRKEDNTTGWEAEVYIFLKGTLVIHKEPGEKDTPNVDRLKIEKKPLCLLQEPIDIILKHTPTP